MKQTALISMIILLATQLAFAESQTFRVSATIPKIIGINYFPQEVEIGSTDDQDVIQQLVLRDGQEFMLQTTIVK